MHRKLRCAPVLIAFTLGMVGCTGDRDSPAESNLDPLSKITARPVVKDPAGGLRGDPPVACCLPDGTCEDMAPMDCMAEGGMPQMMGASCADTDCADDGHHGDDPAACCFEDGTCEDMAPMDCMAEGGMPQMMGTSCDTTDCTDGGGHGGGGHGGGHGGGG